MIDLVTVGWLTVDDIVLPEGSCQKDVLGGGALYSAVGAQIWGRRVGIHSAAGAAYLDYTRGTMAEQELDVEGIAPAPGNGLQLWILHESQKTKQQIPKLSSSTALEMDAGRGPLPDSYKGARGFHIAPQGSASTLANIRALRDLPSDPIVTLDVLADAYVDPTPYRESDFLTGVTAFLPSDAEVGRLWQPTDLESWAREQARRFACHVAVKCGAEGSLICEAGGGQLHQVPALPVTVVDTTGAGDAYCGGFLAGLLENRPVEECAGMGTVSASYIVEARGALATRRPDTGDREARLAAVMSEIRAFRTV